MHGLHAQALRVAFETQAGRWLAKPLRRRRDSLVQHLGRQPVWLVNDHHSPVQLVPLPTDEILDVIRPLQAFERRLDEVFPHAAPERSHPPAADTARSIWP